MYPYAYHNQLSVLLLLFISRFNCGKTHVRGSNAFLKTKHCCIFAGKERKKTWDDSKDTVRYVSLIRMRNAYYLNDCVSANSRKISIRPLTVLDTATFLH